MLMIESIKNALKQYGHHMIFGASILSLALLVTWWSVFLNQSIEKHRLLHRENLESIVKFLSLELGSDPHNPPAAGVFKRDKRLEITTYHSREERFARPLLPGWPRLCIRVRENVLGQIDDELKRKKIMVIGESGFLFLLILLSSVFLYKYIQLEKRSTREMEEFWDRVTHEIKTPITGIKAFLQSLKNQSLNESQLPAFLDMALKQVEKQEQLAENILAGSRLTYKNHNYRLNMVDLTLTEFIKNYFDGHTVHLADAALDIELNPVKPGVKDRDTNEDIKVRADAHAVRAILDNIVDNAVKYCSPGLVLKVRVFTVGRKAVVEISDNGPGFTSDMAEKIFEAYKHRTGQLPGTNHGTGMGLCISRKLARRMGGELKAPEKKEDRGARFLLFLNRIQSK